MSNPKSFASPTEVPLLARRHRFSLKSVLVFAIIGFALGLFFTCLSFVSGFHGNLPYVWLYICGPTIWLIEAFASSDKFYVITLVTGSIIQWIFYMLALGYTPGRARTTSVVLVTFHVGCAATYHWVVGL
jgi:hypothetical protein